MYLLLAVPLTAVEDVLILLELGTLVELDDLPWTCTASKQCGDAG